MKMCEVNLGANRRRWLVGSEQNGASGKGGKSRSITFANRYQGGEESPKELRNERLQSRLNLWRIHSPNRGGAINTRRT